MKHSTCDECASNKHEIMLIKVIITEIKTDQMKDRKNTISKEVESSAKIKFLWEENDEMASEIAFLKATISEPVRDNESMHNNLDLKQNEWLEVENKPSSSKAIFPDSISTPRRSQFETLTDENNENLSNTETQEITKSQMLRSRTTG